MFLLVTDNAEKMLPTVRSRCTELALNSLPENILREALEKTCPQASSQQITGAIGRSGGYLGQAVALLEESEDASQTTVSFLNAYAAADTVGLLNVLVPMEKWKRDALAEELERWLPVLVDALAAKSGRPITQPMADAIGARRSGSEIMHGIASLQKAIEYTKGNISPGAVCGYLQWELR